jgi:hypothetical protein
MAGLIKQDAELTNIENKLGNSEIKSDKKTAKLTVKSY